MENKATSETLEKDFVESKVSEALQEVNFVSLCSLSEECTDDVYSGHIEVSHVNLARKLDNGSLNESTVFDDIDGNNQINKGSVDSCPSDQFLVLTNSNEMNVNVPVLEGDSKFSANEGDHMLHPHEPSSPTKIEVSGSGINLFVEVFGPLDGISGGNNDLKRTLGEGNSNQECSLEENGAMSSGVKNVSAKNEVEDIVGDQEFTFDVGDLVWVKTKTPLWWPGMISDPSNAANDAMKPEKRGSYVVKYFGNANFIWCQNADLKPFVEYFEQFSGQNNSRSFFGSVEKALSVIGQRVKSKMTCPCFSKDRQTLAAAQENSMSMGNKGKSDVLSLSQFEPTTFCASVRNLARSVNVPSKIELTIMKNRLSAFYSSNGHLELPLQMLRSGTDANSQDVLTSEGLNEARKKTAKVRDSDVTPSRRKKKRKQSYDADIGFGDNIASWGKGFESRERKKSKYLSYPYVDVNEKLNESSNSGQETGDTKSTPVGSMNSRKRSSKKPSCQKADNIDASSAELLSELFYTARDCFYLSGSKYSDSLKQFYSSFRMFAFLDVDIASKDQQEQPNLEKCLKKNSTEAQVQVEGIRGAKESENKTVNIAPVEQSVENALANKSSETHNPQAKANVVRKRAKKKKEQVLSAGLEPMNSSFNMGTNNYPNNGSWMISFQQTTSDAPKSKTTPSSTEGLNPGLSQVDPTARLPDLNGDQPSFSVNRIPAVGPPTNCGQPLPDISGGQQMVFSSIPLVKEARVGVQNIPQSNDGINGTNNQCWNQEFTTREVGTNVINTGLGPCIQQSFQMGSLFPSAVKPERKKRKRKEKTSQDASAIPEKTSQDASAIPDLNGNLPEGNHVLSPEDNPQQKKRRSNKYATADGEVNLGGSLLLSFAPGLTLPSKETLVATFSRFGLLKESEMQVLNDTSVQIVYERSSEARFAFRSLEKNNPFGESLMEFKLHCVPDTPRAVERKKKQQMVQRFAPVEASKNSPAKPGETTRDITFIRQNVEMMKMTLEKAGDNLSPEMRAKLENEIKGFLDKIGSMGGGPASA